MTLRSKATALGRLLKGDSEKRWAVAARVALAAHPDAVIGEYGKSWRRDADFVDALTHVPAADNQLDRVFALDQLARHAARLDGDFAECGTYTGVSAWFLCRRAEAAAKTVALFDSWDGLSDPSPADGTYWTAHDLRSPRDIAEKTLAQYHNARFYQGWIPERFGEVDTGRFALVHIDVDLYQPTRDSLAFFYPRLVDRGILVCDDYGFDTCPGAREAFDEFCAEHDEVGVELPTGQGFIIKSRSR